MLEEKLKEAGVSEDDIEKIKKVVKENQKEQKNQALADIQTKIEEADDWKTKAKFAAIKASTRLGEYT